MIDRKPIDIRSEIVQEKLAVLRVRLAREDCWLQPCRRPGQVQVLDLSIHQTCRVMFRRSEICSGLPRGLAQLYLRMFFIVVLAPPPSG
jgi:hypothetical protein